MAIRDQRLARAIGHGLNADFDLGQEDRPPLECRGAGDTRRAAQAFLHDLSGVTEWKQHRFTKPVTWIGRIVMDPLPDADQLVIEKATVGRRHALIEYRQQDFWLSDHDSVNGTFVNGRRIAAETRLKHGDRIRVGDCECFFEMPAMAMAEETSLLAPGTLRGAIARQERRAPRDAVREGSGEVAARPLGALGLGEISEDRLAMAAGQEDLTESGEESPATTGLRTVATRTATRPSKQERFTCVRFLAASAR